MGFALTPWECSSDFQTFPGIEEPYLELMPIGVIPPMFSATAMCPDGSCQLFWGKNLNKNILALAKPVFS